MQQMGASGRASRGFHAGSQRVYQQPANHHNAFPHCL